jgi:hypothetical protein
MANVVGYTESFPHNNSVCLLSCGLGHYKGTITDPTWRPVAYFVPNKHLNLIKLSEPPYGPVVAPSNVHPGGRYMTNLRWPDHDKTRWRTYLQSLLVSLTAMELRG